MSETGRQGAMQTRAAPNAGGLSASTRSHRLSPLEAVERGFAVFRFTFAREAWRYYAGTAPLVLCFIPMWVVNGQIKVSDDILLFEAILLAIAYVLRVILVARYMQRVRTMAFGTPPPKRVSAGESAAGIAALVGRKIVLSVSALASLPSVVGTSWFYSACQFASIEEREEGAQSGSMGDCLSLSSQWLSGGLLYFLMLFPLWSVVWLNGVIVALAVPQLLHSIFGLNTILSTSMGIYALARSSAFWLLAFAGAWMALDPIVKCSFVIVYQHLRSRREGYDLRDALANLPRQKKPMAMASGRSMRNAQPAALIALFALMIGAWPVLASPKAQESTIPTPAANADDAARTARVQTLRHALDQESQRAIYRWHDADHPNPPNWFDKLMSKIGQAIGRAWNAIVRFLANLWPKGLSGFGGNGTPGKWSLKDLAVWVSVIAVVTIGAIVALVWLRRRREPESLSIPASVAPLPDLSDAVLATARSEDEWFALANRLEREGDLRSALRAAYLGLLAGLAQREWLTIRRDRTNRDYLDEFTRRWRRRPQATVDARTEVPGKLGTSMRQFDRVWYGFQVPTAEALAAYRRDQKELLSHV